MHVLQGGQSRRAGGLVQERRLPSRAALGYRGGMSSSGDPWGEFSRRAGKGPAGADESGARGMFDRVREAPPWKLALLGGAALAAAGTALFSLFLALAAAFVLVLLFSTLLGRSDAAQESAIEISPPVTYH